jgi:hypothetical protein
MLPSTSCTPYTLSASVAGPLITAPVVMSNREPWHWHMIVVPVSGPPESGHAWSVQVHNASTEPGADDHHVVVEAFDELAPSLVVMGLRRRHHPGRVAGLRAKRIQLTTTTHARPTMGETNRE